MSFVKKTLEQIKALTPEEEVKYFAEKDANDLAEMNKAIETAVNVVKESVEGTVSSLKAELETAKEDVAKAVKKGEDLEEVTLKQGLQIKQNTLGGDAQKTLAEEFEEKFNEVTGAKKDENGRFIGDTKRVEQAIVINTKGLSTDVLSMGTATAGQLPTAGSFPVVTPLIRTMFGKLLGYFGYRKPTSMILDLIDVSPLDNSQLVVINETYLGDAEITPECTIKPVVKMKFETQTSDAQVVAAEWFTTTQIRRFFANLVNRMEQKFGEIVNDKMPTVVLDIVKTGASAFTPDTTYQISTNVNNYDVIGAVLASLETLGFMPNAIIMHPKAWRNMLQEKDTTGAYALQNGGSINIVGGGLDWGGFFIPYIKDTTLLVDEFIIGDLFSCVKAGVDSQLMYMETDGRTDENTSATSGLSRNIRTHVLEKFFAVIIPDATKAGIIKDTFANVKSLIIKP